jgi:hypothetical protein
MVGEPSARTRDWVAVWEKALAETAGQPPFERVYPGPVWESAGPTGAPGTGVWKIAVLERQSTAGAEHLGHLFVVVAEDPKKVVLRPESGLAANPNRMELESLSADPGVPWRLLIRPRSAETASRLRAFALEFQRHALPLAKD